MTATDLIPELDARYSSPGAEPRPWAEVSAALDAAEMFWLTTVRRDGRPHVCPLPAMWLDGALHFATGRSEQKARNLAGDARCILTTGNDRFREGLDVVVEGVAERVTDPALLARLARRWQDKLAWTYEVVADGFRQEGVDGPAHVFAVAPAKVLAFGKGEPFSQTRYRAPR
jgi:hypothetical protein